MFLNSVAQYYLDRHSSSNWSDLYFVFPSHRAGVLFLNELRSEVKKRQRTIFGVNTGTINEFFNSHTSLMVADDITLAFELFEVYREVYKPDADFESFYSWARTFIGDFDDIDKYLVDAEDIFTNTLELERIVDKYDYLTDNQLEAIQEFWNVTFARGDAKGDEKRNYIELYEKMLEIYKTFRKRLQDRGLAYQGIIYKNVAESLDKIWGDDEKHYVFVGFNALTRAEENIFTYLRKGNYADFFWDYTPEMLTPIQPNDEHGPGRFVRRYADKFPAPRDYSLPVPAEKPKVEIISFAYPQGQLNFVNNYLSDKYEGGTRSAVVLTDENMLLGVLSALPQNVHQVNVTMGYPIKLTPLYGLLGLLRRLHAANYVRNADADVQFYHRNVLPILHHPAVHALCGDELVRELCREISSKNIVWPKASMLARHPLLSLIFAPLDSAKFISYLLDIYEFIYNNVPENDQLQRECSYNIAGAVRLFGSQIVKAGVDISSVDLLFGMVDCVVAAQTVDFCGMPHAGLQVLGILETRALDFDNLVILDLNEGVFPKNATAPSFIPYNLRVGFGLPTHEHQDSIFSYYFFRLIQRAKNVHLLYSTSLTGDRNGVSRFLLQLQHEFKIETTNYVATNSIKDIGNKEVNVEKTDKIFEFICGIDHISPTSLIKYISCPLSFFYQKIYHISNPDDEANEEIDNRLIGNVFHGVMEDLYRCDAPLAITKEFVDNISKECIEKLTLKHFGEELGLSHFSKEDLNYSGRNLLFFDLIVEYVRKMLDYDARQGVTILAVEKELSVPVVLDNGHTINIKGKIDRIHERNGVVYVCDYKTGSDDKFDIDSLDKLFKSDEILKIKAVLQVLLYCYMLCNDPENPYSDDLKMIVYKVKELSNGSAENIIKKGDRYKDKNEFTYKEVRKEFEKLLRRCLSGLFDVNRPFVQTEDVSTEIGDACKYCDFVNLCGL